MAVNFITIRNHLRVRAQKVIIIQLRSRPAHLPHPRAMASCLRLRLIIDTPTSTAEGRRLYLQAILAMETRPPGLAVRKMAIISRPNLHINPEMTITGHGTRIRTGGIHTMANTRKVRGMSPPYRPPARPPQLLSQHRHRPQLQPQP